MITFKVHLHGSKIGQIRLPIAQAIALRDRVAHYQGEPWFLLGMLGCKVRHSRDRGNHV